MREIVKFIIWLVFIIMVFRLATWVIGAVFGSLVSLALLALIGWLIFKAASK